MTDLQKEYTITEEDLFALSDYIEAALNGDESKTTIRRLFDQEFNVIRSRTHSSSKSEQEKVLDKIIKLSMMLDTNETERWENIGRPKNDGYINGSHSGYSHAMRDLRQWIDRIKKMDLKL